MVDDAQSAGAGVIEARVGTAEYGIEWCEMMMRVAIEHHAWALADNRPGDADYFRGKFAAYKHAKEKFRDMLHADAWAETHK